MTLQMKTIKITKKQPYIPDHPCRIIIIGDSGSGKTNAMLNLIKEKDSEPKSQFLIKKREDKT